MGGMTQDRTLRCAQSDRAGYRHSEPAGGGRRIRDPSLSPRVTNPRCSSRMHVRNESPARPGHESQPRAALLKKGRRTIVAENVLEGKGRLYITEDSNPVAEVSYRLVRRRRHGSYLGKSSCKLRFEQQCPSLHEPGSPTTREMTLKLEDGRTVTIVGTPRVSGVPGVRSTTSYQWDVLSGPE